MSYDIELCDANTGEVLQTDFKHQLKGGTYAVGGTTEASLNITFNYAKHYYRVFGERGIRAIYGMTGNKSIPVLVDAIGKLNDDYDDDYWKPTEGNAKLALINLLQLATLLPNGVWKGD